METISEAKEKKPKLQYRLLWNKYRAGTKSAQELTKDVEPDVSTFSTKLGFRVAYADALASGLSVAEWKDKKAKQEIINLTNEIIELLG